MSGFHLNNVIFIVLDACFSICPGNDARAMTTQAQVDGALTLALASAPTETAIGVSGPFPALKRMRIAGLR
jgi:hypothetical protein